MDKKELVEKAKVIFADNKGLKAVWMCSDGVGYQEQQHAVQYQKTVDKGIDPILVDRKESKKNQEEAGDEAKKEAPEGK